MYIYMCVCVSIFILTLNLVQLDVDFLQNLTQLSLLQGILENLYLFCLWKRSASLNLHISCYIGSMCYSSMMFTGTRDGSA